jgi:CubicO group peptidase (beta-lactamase class C family)
VNPALGIAHTNPTDKPLLARSIKSATAQDFHLKMWPIALTSLFYVPLVASAALNRRSGGAQILTPAVDVFINKLFTEWNSPGGAAVAVVRMDGQGRWLVETKGYGFAKADGTKVGPETMFAIGSNSEVCTFYWDFGREY